MPASKKNGKTASRRESEREGGRSQPEKGQVQVLWAWRWKQFGGTLFVQRKPPGVGNVKSLGPLDLCKVVVPESATGCRLRGQGNAGGPGVELPLPPAPAPPQREHGHPAAEVLQFFRLQGEAVGCGGFVGICHCCSHPCLVIISAWFPPWLMGKIKSLTCLNFYVCQRARMFPSVEIIILCLWTSERGREREER